MIVRDGDAAVETGLKKFGAIVGDFAEIGCNSVLCPGCIVGRGAQVYPLSLVRGRGVPADSVYKKQGEVAPKQEPIPAGPVKRAAPAENGSHIHLNRTQGKSRALFPF